MQDAVFIDTWGWIALGYRKDSRHSEVRSFYRELRARRGRAYTTDFVLDEVATLLFRREPFSEAVRFIEGIFAAADLGSLNIERVTSQRFTEAWRLRKVYQDKPSISFTDLTSIAIMQELGITHVLTDDDHFVQVALGFSKVP